MWIRAKKYCAVVALFALAVLLPFSSTSLAAQKCQNVFLTVNLTEPVFGPEFTFTNKRLSDEAKARGETPYKNAKLAELRQKFEDFCANNPDPCRVLTTYDKHGSAFIVKYSSDFGITVALDSSVIEVKVTPGTLGYFQKHAARVENAFAMMAQSELKPHFFKGGGHIHMSYDVFGDNGDLLRDFFVDYANHPEVTFKALGYNLVNSPPISALKSEQRDALENGLKDFDRRRIRRVKDFKNMIENKVYTDDLRHLRPNWQQHSITNYYQTIRFWTEATNFETMELRNFRPQKDFKTYLLQLELLRARLNYLANRTTRVAYTNREALEFSEEESVKIFHRYIIETGLDWDRFKYLLSDQYLATAERLGLKNPSEHSPSQ